MSLLLALPALAGGQDPGAVPPAPSESPPTAEAAPAAEWFVDLFYGEARAGDARTGATHAPGCLLCTPPPPVTAEEAVDLRGTLGGLRCGAVDDRFGVALELGWRSLRSDRVEASYALVALEPMARARFLRSAGVPNGRLQVHGGILLAWVPLGRMEADLFGLPATVTAEKARGGAIGAFAGGSVNWRSAGIFVELRGTHTSITFESERLFDDSRSELSFDAVQALVGVRVQWPPDAADGGAVPQPPSPDLPDTPLP